MIKLLVTLAAVAAIAAASTSAAVEYPDLEDLDADGLQDDVVDDEVDVAGKVEDRHILRSGLTPYNTIEDERVCHRLTVNGLLKYRSATTLFYLRCPLGQFRTWFVSRMPLIPSDALQVSRCKRCPVGRPATAYGRYSFNCGVSSCFACDPGHTFRRRFRMCLTDRQFHFMLRNEWEDDDVEEEANGSLGGKGGGNHTLQSQVQTLQEDLQQVEEATVPSCCLPGWFGRSPSDCHECPEERPSSPHTAGGGPGAGSCPNAQQNQCFECPCCHKIRPASLNRNDPASICTPISGCNTQQRCNAA